MIYEYIHEIVSTLFIDLDALPESYKIFVYLFEFWGCFIFFKWAIMPLRYVIEGLKMISKTIVSDHSEWRPEWTRKQKRSLRNNDQD